MSKQFLSDEQLKVCVNSGLSVFEIADKYGYKDGQCLYIRVKQLGLKANNYRRKSEEITEKVVSMRKGGATYKEIAERLGIDQHRAGEIARLHNVGYSDDERENLKNARAEQLRGNPTRDVFLLADLVKQKSGGRFEFVSYEGTNEHGEGRIKIKCIKHGATKVCGSQIFKPCNIKRPLWFGFFCPGCAEERKVETLERAKERAKERQKEKEEQQKEKEEREFLKKLEKGYKQITLSLCSRCGGALSDGDKKVCKKCKREREREQERRKEHNRRKRAKGGNNKITLRKVYERDKGVCYLCGSLCDYKDFLKRGDVFIAGRTYPSIDHVVPLSKGGKHLFNNVRLACFYCNTCKNDKMITPPPL